MVPIIALAAGIGLALLVIGAIDLLGQHQLSSDIQRRLREHG